MDTYQSKNQIYLRITVATLSTNQTPADLTFFDQRLLVNVLNY